VRVLKQGIAAKIMVLMVSADDGKTGLDGLTTFTTLLYKDGGDPVVITPTITPRSKGWYTLQLTTAHTDTIGDLAVHVEAAGADQSDRLCVVETATLSDVDTETDAIVTAVAAISVPTTAQIDAALTAVHGSGSWQSASGTGSGDTPVDHNTGGTDALRYLTSAGVPVDNGAVVAYLKSSYDAGDLSAPVGAIVTRSDGRWRNPLLLDHGVAYTLLFYKQGVYQPASIEVTP
jgi:hypothetical protein